MSPPQQIIPRWSRRLTRGVLLLMTCHQVSALDLEYCSDINTSSNAKNTSIFQSNGLCYTFCQTYAFAVLQGNACWCSDYIPDQTTEGCNQACPGYPADRCGGSGLYGYIALPNAPAGTKGRSSATSTTPQVTVTDPVTSFSTVTETLPAPTTSIAVSSSSTGATTRTTPTTASSTWTPTPVTSLETVTGTVRTVTVTPTVPPNAQSSPPVSKPSAGGLSTGAAVGLTAGLIALVAITCSIIYFCLRKHREHEVVDNGSVGGGRGSSAGLGIGNTPTRAMSENSRYVLGTDGHRVVETWEPKDTEVRRSKLMPVDPRLDPFAPVYRTGDNKSRDSVNTLRDDHDYSRRVHGPPILRATNPDE